MFANAYVVSAQKTGPQARFFDHSGASGEAGFRIVVAEDLGVGPPVVDGVAVGCDCDIGYIEVKKADKKVSFITRYDTDFFNKLLIKLNIWSK